MNRPTRHGRRLNMSRVDLLFLLGSLTALACLLVPTLVNEGSDSRGAQCRNNLRQFGIAIASRASYKTGVYPGYLQVLKIDPQLGATADRYPATDEIDMEISWAGLLLPNFDQQSLWESALSDPKFDWKHPPQLDLFRCPSDAYQEVELPSISYVANTGMPDITKTLGANPSDLKANGIFHDLRPDRNGPQLRPVDLKDGSATTLLFTENVHRDHNRDGHSWLAPSANSTNLEQWYGFVWVYDKNSPLEPSKELIDDFNQDTRVSQKRESPYSQFGSRFARPASNHPGVFLVVFAGGNSRTISEGIDYRVYQQLMTPNGSKAQSLAAPGADMKVLMDPKLSETDY